MKSWWKQGKTGEKKPRLSHFRTTLPVVRNFRTTHPLCENAFVPILKKCMLSVPSQNPLCEFHRNANLVQTLCEFVFGTNFQNHALCLGTPQECKIFAQHKVSCEICTSSLKVVFSSPNAKLLLHFSQHLSSDHPIPSLSPFSSSFPTLSTTMAAHLHNSTP